MNSRRTFLVLFVVNCILILALLAGAYFANSLLVSRSKKLVTQRLETATLDAQATALVRAKQDVATYSELSNIARSIVPQDKDQAQTVREIVNIAAKNGIKLGSITFPSSTLGQKATAGAVSGISQLAAVPGLTGVLSLQIVVQSDPNAPILYSKLLDFLDDLEHNRRTALVSDISLTPNSNNNNKLTFNLTLDEYLKP
ncbi:hypothetical protein KDA23_03565 [Candidatus Saccharibacteria bacterium]|nr:hypothetical protein [Candidatus Saccharibacteria bacterium]